MAAVVAVVAEEACSLNLVSLVETPIDVMHCIDWVRDPTAGAVSTFIGTTRDTFEDKRVISLEYEAYSEMALTEMTQICTKVKYNILHCSFTVCASCLMCMYVLHVPTRSENSGT
jgi:hypothetical protein